MVQDTPTVSDRFMERKKKEKKREMMNPMQEKK